MKQAWSLATALPLALAPVAAAMLGLAPVAAAACEPGPGFRAPTNLELAGHAETIVVAKVTGEQRDERGRPVAVVITPLTAIKGELPQGEIALQGTSLAEGGRAVTSRPFEFERPHPDTYSGACIRTVFPLGTTALFFLRIDHEGMWAPAGTAFSRWAEDVADADAPWVQLAKLYVIAASLPAEDRAPFLEGEREALLERRDEPLAQLMADDIARQIAGPAAPPPDPFEEAFRHPADESAVETTMKRMREAAVEAGN
jgi:hypothetical protein